MMEGGPNLSMKAALMLYQKLKVTKGQFRTQSKALPASE
jgi:hypothetical protein